MGLVNSELIPDQNIQNLLQAYLVADQKVTQLKGAARRGAPRPCRRDREPRQDQGAARGAPAGLRERPRDRLQGGGGARRRAGEPAREGQGRPDPVGAGPHAAVRGGRAEARRRDAPATRRSGSRSGSARSISRCPSARSRSSTRPSPRAAPEPAELPAQQHYLALVFGSVLGVGVALTLEYFDTSLRDVADIEDRLKIPVLGVIPVSRDADGRRRDEPGRAEPYRVLHTNLNLALPSPASPACSSSFPPGPRRARARRSAGSRT